MTAAALVAIAIAALALTGTQADAEINGSLDKNWRGAYDILITPPGQDFGGSETAGLVDANFVSTAGGGGISTRKLAQVRDIPDVEVAAPVGLVGTLRDTTLTPSLFVPDDLLSGDTVLSSEPELLRVTTSLERTDGGTPALLAKTSGLVALTARAGSPAADPTSGLLTAVSEPSGFGPQTDDRGFQIPLGQLPAFPSTVIAVDPAAEAQLWPNRASYLDDLRDVPRERSAATEGAAWADRVDEKDYLVQRSQLETAAEDSELSGRAVVPLALNSTAPARLKLTVHVEQAPLGARDLPDQGAQLTELAADATFKPVGDVALDASDATRPFSSLGLSAPWPGQSNVEAESGVFYSSATDLEPLLMGRPAYASKTGDGGNAFTVQAQGVTGADGGAPGGEFAETSGNDTSVGTTTSYRSAEPTHGSGFAGALPAPIVTFSADESSDGDTAAVSYVPSGIYSGSDPQVQNPSNQGAEERESVRPTLAGRGFFDATPGAFTDLKGGEALRGATAIDAVRLRVAGITTYDDAAQQKVATVAARVTQLGLRATVVAGSSLQPVKVYVPDYFNGVDGTQADLGWVRQEWTTLGASVTVNAAFSGIGRALAILSATSVAFLFTAAQLMSIRRHRQTSRLLADMGWKRSSIARRILADYLPGLVLIAGAGVGTIALVPVTSGTGLASRVAVAALVAIACSAAVLGVVLSLRTPRRRSRRSPLRPVTSINRLSFRQAFSSPYAATLQILGPLIIGVTTALAVAVSTVGRAAAGSTRLAEAVMNASTVALALITAVGVVAGLVLAGVGQRDNVRQQRKTLRILHRSGFSECERARVTRGQAFVRSGTCLIVAVALAAAATFTGLISPGATLAGLVAIALVCITTMIVSPKGALV